VRGKEGSDLAGAKVTHREALRVPLFVSSARVASLLSAWGKFMVLTLELPIQLSCLLFLGRIRIALISNKVDCFGVQSQVLE